MGPIVVIKHFMAIQKVYIHMVYIYFKSRIFAIKCIYIYTLQIHSVEHSYGLGGESLRETFTICIMHRSLLAV